MSFQLKDSESYVPVMVYMHMRVLWGKLIAPKMVRVPTWLKMTMVPDIFHFAEAEMLVFGGAQPARLSFSEFFLPKSEILAFHVLPPTEVELDYDPNEPNREMKPVVAITSIFRFDGRRRISTLGDFNAALQSNKETYAPLYDVTVTHPTTPSMRGITVPYVLLLAKHTNFALTS